ncbi:MULTISPECIES: GNAT family N-acetyltransferase [unclassified Variovorax]|uniref:GNAT family N-acetyltransferase n=1 Tax=unclassified Variovorax TaxID=663243 RepID=UPI001BD57FE8|nr:MULTISPECIES: GNAT family N-acetyltransferase [unclassified Variovorax]
MSHSVSRPLPLADAPEIILLMPDEPHEMEATRAIFREYAASLDFDLGFQNFEEEVAGLPGEYAEPRGALLIALVDAADVVPGIGAPLLTRSDGRLACVAGCCALRPLDTVDEPNAAEMKRLYVRPAFRGFGLGRQLAEAALDAARSAGYACVLLDTLDEMELARAMYEDLGFEEVPPYYHNPIPGAHYLKAEL